jgi:hypothetical protein
MLKLDTGVRKTLTVFRIIGEAIRVWVIGNIKVQLFCPQKVADDDFRTYPRLQRHR